MLNAQLSTINKAEREMGNLGWNDFYIVSFPRLLIKRTLFTWVVRMNLGNHLKGVDPIKQRMSLK